MYLLPDRDQLEELDHNINNILDWRCNKRKQQITAQAAELAQLTFDKEEAKKVKRTIEAAHSNPSTPGSRRKGAGRQSMNLRKLLSSSQRARTVTGIETRIRRTRGKRISKGFLEFLLAGDG